MGLCWSLVKQQKLKAIIIRASWVALGCGRMQKAYLPPLIFWLVLNCAREKARENVVISAHF